MERLVLLSSRVVPALAMTAALTALITALVYTWTPSVELREAALVAGATGAVLILIATSAVLWNSTGLARRLMLGMAIAATYTALALFGFGEITLRSMRGRILALPPERIAPLGRHVIAGYRQRTELTRLIARGAVGGVFITARNTRGLSAEALAAEIASFQSTARRNGHPPLIIATDQEGGMISRLSPPLPRPPALATLVQSQQDRQSRIRDVAVAAGRDLASVGVTLNFAPVVDLDFGQRTSDDRYSRIGERAIAADPAVVSAAAREYCAGLAVSNVLCTLKHFPGLGRVAADTHVASAVLTTPRADLEAKDWQPYRGVIANGEAAIMVGHVNATALDSVRPASTSPRVVDVLRYDWGFEGLIVTDDLTMAAARNSTGGVGGAAVSALAAGVDLILVAWDTDQVYTVLDALMRARATGYLENPLLRQSADRLDRRLAATVRLVPWYQPSVPLTLKR